MTKTACPLSLFVGGVGCRGGFELCAGGGGRYIFVCSVVSIHQQTLEHRAAKPLSFPSHQLSPQKYDFSFVFFTKNFCIVLQPENINLAIISKQAMIAFWMYFLKENPK